MHVVIQGKDNSFNTKQQNEITWIISQKIAFNIIVSMDYAEGPEIQIHVPLKYAV